MSPYVTFGRDTIIEAFALAAIAYLGWRLRCSRARHRAYMGRLRVRSERAPEDILWILYRRRDAQAALRIAKRREETLEVRHTAERIERGNALLAATVGLHVVKGGS